MNQEKISPEQMRAMAECLVCSPGSAETEEYAASMLLTIANERDHTRMECRFGEGGIGVAGGDVAGRPAVFLTELSECGVVGEQAKPANLGQSRVAMTFPTREQAVRVWRALVNKSEPAYQEAIDRAQRHIADLRELREVDQAKHAAMVAKLRETIKRIKAILDGDDHG